MKNPDGHTEVGHARCLVLTYVIIRRNRELSRPFLRCLTGRMRNRASIVHTFSGEAGDHPVESSCAQSVCLSFEKQDKQRSFFFVFHQKNSIQSVDETYRKASPSTRFSDNRHFLFKVELLGDPTKEQ